MSVSDRYDNPADWCEYMANELKTAAEGAKEDDVHRYLMGKFGTFTFVANRLRERNATWEPANVREE